MVKTVGTKRENTVGPGEIKKREKTVGHGELNTTENMVGPGEFNKIESTGAQREVQWNPV